MTLPPPRPLPLVAGVIGWPVAHSRSPIIHRFWLEKLGLDGDYSRFPVAPERLADFVRAMPAMGLRGANVTIPHKVAVMDLLDDIDDTALSVGAVNTLKLFEDGRIGGVNTDIEGIMFPCRDLGIAGREVIVIGNGGAARAAGRRVVARGRREGPAGGDRRGARLRRGDGVLRPSPSASVRAGAQRGDGARAALEALRRRRTRRPRAGWRPCAVLLGT